MLGMGLLIIVVIALIGAVSLCFACKEDSRIVPRAIIRIFQQKMIAAKHAMQEQKEQENTNERSPSPDFAMQQHQTNDQSKISSNKVLVNIS